MSAILVLYRGYKERIKKTEPIPYKKEDKIL